MANLNSPDLSLLDRLIDENPRSTTESVRTPPEWERIVRESVLRDIESLFSTRSWLGTWPQELHLLKFSILNCGLPDVSGTAIDNKVVQGIIRNTARMALEVFEPRLKNVNVILTNAMGDRTARIVINAELRSTSESLSYRRAVGGAKQSE